MSYNSMLAKLADAIAAEINNPTEGSAAWSLDFTAEFTPDPAIDPEREADNLVNVSIGRYRRKRNARRVTEIECEMRIIVVARVGEDATTGIDSEKFDNGLLLVEEIEDYFYAAENGRGLKLEGFSYMGMQRAGFDRDYEGDWGDAYAPGNLDNQDFVAALVTRWRRDAKCSV